MQNLVSMRQWKGSIKIAPLFKELKEEIQLCNLKNWYNINQILRDVKRINLCVRQ